MILYHVYYAFMPFITYIWTTFVQTTFSKSIIFKVKSTFEPNMFKWAINFFFLMSSSLFSLLIINVKILSNFQKEWCTFGREKKCLKKIGIVHFRGLSTLNMQKHFWFVPNFEHVNFAINIPKKIWQSKLLCFPCDLSNILKCSFKKCPLIWVASLILILPINYISYKFSHRFGKVYKWLNMYYSNIKIIIILKITIKWLRKIFYVDGKEVGSTHPPFLSDLVLANIELWPFFCGGYLTLQKIYKI